MFLCFEFANFIFSTISIDLWVEVNVSSELAFYSRYFKITHIDPFFSLFSIISVRCPLFTGKFQ